MKINNYIRGLAIFLLFLIPLIYLYHYLNKLELREKILSNELIKDQLLREMDKFQDDLKPEIYIASAFKELEKALKLPDINNFQYNYSYNEEVKPDFIDKNFINKSKAFLKEKYGFEPFIFVSSGFDFTNNNIEDKYNIFKNERVKNQFLLACIKSILNHQYQLDSRKLDNLKACIPSNTNILKKEINKIFNIETDYTSIKNLTQETDSYDLLLIKYISLFYKLIGEADNCLYYFSNYFGNENIYQFHNIFFRKSNNIYNYLGLYYALIKSSDISIDVMLTNVTSKKEEKYNSKIIRTFSDTVVTTPTWYFSDSEIKYNIPFPFYFYNTIKKQQTVNDSLYQKYFNYVRNHSLEVSIDKSQLRNNYSKYKNYVILVIYVILICFIIYNIGIYLDLIRLNISLSIKIKFIVAVSVLIPIIGLWLIINITLKNEGKSYLTNIQNKVLERINLFDKLKEDIINSFTFDLLEHKKIFADEYFKTTPDKFYDKYLQSNSFIKKDYKTEEKNIVNRLFRTNKLLPYKIVSYIRFLDKEGYNLKFTDYNKLGTQPKVQDILHLYRYLSDLNILNKNSDANKKIQQQIIFLSTYADQYLNTYNTRNDLAKESRLIPSETLTLKDKVAYQLISSAKNPNLPLALIYNWIGLKNLMAYRFTEPIVNNHLNLLEQKIGLVQVKYAFFERDADEFREKVIQQKTYPFWKLQLDSAKKALQKNSSGSEITEDEGNYYFKVWRYYLDNPLIIVGAAVIPKTQSNLISSNIITLLLIIYSILIVVLLSDFFSGALLEPIKTLFSFVKEISLGHLKVKINMKTGDELQELSNSFNNMSTGLCEREKLKRFLSDRLFSSLKSSTDSKIAQAKVTVLSSDIRNFTTISEKNNPEEVVQLLNDYFTLMEKSIVKYGGSIEKYVGDAISAAFYEENNKNHALNACKAALEMRENLKIFNQQRIANNKFTIENGIGLTTGNVMIGFAGEKARRREFLLIGKIIKQAEELESKTKKGISSKVFIDKSTYELIKDEIRVCKGNNDPNNFYKELEL